MIIQIEQRRFFVRFKLVAGLAGFVAFIMERIEDYKAHAESNQSAKLLETGQTVNVTCPDH